MRIVLNTETCSFHGECVDTLPEVFRWRKDDTVEIVERELDDLLTSRLEEVCRSCPTQSIALELTQKR